MLARRTEVVRAVPGRKGCLRRDKQSRALALDRLSQDFLREPIRVHIRAIEHRDAVVEADVDQALRAGRVGRAPRLEKFIATAKGGSSEAEGRHAQTRLTKTPIFHR